MRSALRFPTTYLVPVVLAALGAAELRAQEGRGNGSAPAAPLAREGSGTGWLPAAAPLEAHHAEAGGWELMLHENAFLHYMDETGERGGRHFGSVNWLMGMARRDVAGGRLTLRAMGSLEPLTVGKCGYPNLLQTGELCNGRPIVNGQHPHDLFMEVSARYERAWTSSLGIQLYAAAVGEPALGPVSFPHRPSAAWSPVAPIGHHWMDASHISFGVATAGLYGRRWKLEGSVFNGREPDEDRYGFDFGPMESYSGRLTVAPTDRWALQVSAASLADAHLHVGVPTPGRGLCPASAACHPIGQIADAQLDVVRITASVLHHRPLGRRGAWDWAFVWGRNAEDGHQPTMAFLAETSLDLDGRHVVFARGEHVEKSDHDLAIPLASDVDVYQETIFRIQKWTAGAARRLPDLGAGPALSLGGGASLTMIPDALEEAYGGTSSVGWFAFVRVSPRPSDAGHAH